MKHLSETGDQIGAPPSPRRLCSVSNMMVSNASGLQLALDRPSLLSLQKTSPTLEIQSLKLSIAALWQSPPEINLTHSSMREIGVLTSKPLSDG